MTLFWHFAQKCMCSWSLKKLIFCVVIFSFLRQLFSVINFRIVLVVCTVYVVIFMRIFISFFKISCCKFLRIFIMEILIKLCLVFPPQKGIQLYRFFRKTWLVGRCLFPPWNFSTISIVHVMIFYQILFCKQFRISFCQLSKILVLLI